MIYPLVGIIHPCQEPINYTVDTWMTERGGGYVVSEQIVWEWIRDIENLVENLEITQKTGECLPTQEVLALKVLVRQIAKDMRKTLQEIHQ